ncbi:MAG: IS21-like element helper ATPase IstB [Candidatus Eremiobacterota bacterium]
MANYDKFLPQLKALRMSGIQDTLDVRIKQAVEQKLSHVEFLGLVLQDEYERRENKKLQMRLRKANFQGNRTLDNFQFDVPKLRVNRSQVFDLATCIFVEERVNVLVVGPTGVGKSHVAQALGHQACMRGFDVLTYDFNKLLGHLRASRADGTYERRLQSLLRPDLLILDDFGLKPMVSPADEDFHTLVSERYERGSIVLTSNLDFTEWGSVFPNPVLASATVDRLRHNAHRLIIEGDSFRKPKPYPGEGRRT